MPAHVTTDIISSHKLSLTSIPAGLVNLLFTVNSTSGLRSDELIVRLKNSMGSGDFYSSLSAYSGINFVNATSAVYVDTTVHVITPGRAPTRMRVPSNGKKPK